jgi:LEA14-like dessication related protein
MDTEKVSKLKAWKVLLLLLVIAIAGLIVYYIFHPKKAVNLVLPEIDEINYVHVDMSNDSIVTEIYTTLQNKMPYKITIDTVYFNIELNNFKVAEETVAVGIGLTYLEMDTVKIPINFPMKRIKKLKDAPELDSVDLTGKFYVVYNTFIGKQKIHYVKTKRIAAPRLPEIQVLNVKVDKLHLLNKTADATITIEVNNRGKYVDMQLNGLKYNLTIKDILVSEGIYSPTINIKPQSKSVTAIPVTIRYDTPVKTAWRIISDDDESEYKLNLRTEIKINNLEKNNLVPVELDATGSIELVK